MRFPMIGGGRVSNWQVPRRIVRKPKPPLELDAIADVVLAYKPKPKSKASKKRKRKEKKLENLDRM